MSGRNLKPLIPYPALLIEEDSTKILVIADLHIGWEINLVEKGIHIPSQINRIITRLLQVIEDCKPERIIILGDIKQAIPRISFEEWESVPKLFEILQKYVDNISVIRGNHDGNLEPLTPPSIKIYPSEGIVVGKKTRIGLFHGHAWPSPMVLGCEILIMGHIHPVLLIRDKLGLLMVNQVWVKTKCDSRKLARAYLKHRNIKNACKPKRILKKKFEIEIQEPKMIIMPAFNDLVGGAPINRLNKRISSPLLNSGSVKLHNAELYLLDGTYVGMVKHVQNNLKDPNQKK